MRSRELLWGLKHNLGRAAMQVEIGNLLLRFAVLINVAIASKGGFSLLEHPACPYWKPQAPSIWLLNEVTVIHAALNSHMNHIDQCSVGAASKKPTMLWCINLPELQARKNLLPGHGYCNHSHGHAVSLRGRIQGQGFRTASAKQYPPGLCKLIADAVHDHIAGNHDLSRLDNQPAFEFEPQDAEFFECFVPLDPYNSDQGTDRYGADFAAPCAAAPAATGGTGTGAPAASPQWGQFAAVNVLLLLLHAEFAATHSTAKP